MLRDGVKKSKKKKHLFKRFLAASLIKYNQWRNAGNHQPFIRDQFYYQQRWQPQSLPSITTNNRNGKCFLLKNKKRYGNFSQKTLRYFPNSTGRSKARSFINKTIIFRKGDTKSTTGRKTQTFFALLEKANFPFENPKDCEKILDTPDIIC